MTSGNLEVTIEQNIFKLQYVYFLLLSCIRVLSTPTNVRLLKCSLHVAAAVLFWPIFVSSYLSYRPQCLRSYHGRPNLH